MAELSIQGAHDEVIVDVYGTDFVVQPATRSTLKAMAKAQMSVESEADEKTKAAQAVEADPEADAEKKLSVFEELNEFRVKAACSVFDAVLKPVEGNTKPSTVIKRKWAADEVVLADLEASMKTVGELLDPKAQTA